MELIVIQCQVEIMYSALWWNSNIRGRRLKKNDSLIDSVACDGKLMYLDRLVELIRIGDNRVKKIARIEDVMEFITFIWICTKVFGS